MRGESRSEAETTRLDRTRASKASYLSYRLHSLKGITGKRYLSDDRCGQVLAKKGSARYPEVDLSCVSRELTLANIRS